MSVLEKKREVTKFMILVEVAASQPQLKQSDIAEKLGITPQAISEYVKKLVSEGMITSEGRGQYSITPLGVEHIINDAKELKEFSDYVLSNVVGQVSAWAAIALDDIEKDQTVYLSMKDGILSCSAKKSTGASGVAINNARAGKDVGVMNLKGLIPLEKERVKLIRVPTIVDGGSHRSDLKLLKSSVSGIVAVAGIEALAACKAANVKPDMMFGAIDAITEAAIKGVTGTIVISMDMVPHAIQKLESMGIDYDTIDIKIKK
ncbi:Crp/Fnr family transcriptional regulator [Methanocella sp. CWC-04]|uniref:Crp/Fnr family transcriptional regulator n=1 Tax=Methanooceanicella nereidis TaxID=2052831 RepID=A0AAP2W602_9EURY|nr:winged helix-turn-helix transcriptional regulator [Methanocella sp. CWC-04]MCD1294717.1 Crp/Fnr family transcriptional regulator [Methanocella sp. CWC-04]